MKRNITYIPFLFILACGCAQEKTSQSGQILTNVVEGVGIPGYLEIGMQLDCIPGKIPGASCEPTSRASLFWWFGETWRKHPPWGEPATHELKIPSVGAVVFERDPTTALHQIHFKAQKDYDWPYFSGTLSSGLSFSATSTVSLAEVIAQYGKPLHTLTYLSAQTGASITNGLQFLKKQEAILASGDSLLLTNTPGHMYRLHYPAHGICFYIQNGRVRSFRILKKVEQKNGHLPKKARFSQANDIR